MNLREYKERHVPPGGLLNPKLREGFGSQGGNFNNLPHGCKVIKPLRRGNPFARPAR